MTSFVTSRDGTRIAVDRRGHGDPVVLVAGMFCDRHRLDPLADVLATRFDVATYDRRGRGDSTNRSPYGVEREIEDLAAVIGELGGSSAVYGHSSGAALALRAAAGGVPITRLVLHEPPYGADDADSRRAATALADTVRAALDDNRPGDAIAAFLTEFGLPPDVVDELSRDPDMVAVAPTMVHDHEVMGDFDAGGTVPDAIVRSISQPTLVLAGAASPEFFRTTAERVSGLLPFGRLTVLDGADHGAAATLVAPPVIAFLSDPNPAIVPSP